MIRRCGGWAGGPHVGRRIWTGVVAWWPLFPVQFTDGACAACVLAWKARYPQRPKGDAK